MALYQEIIKFEKGIKCVQTWNDLSSWREAGDADNTALPKHYFLTLFIFIFR